MVTNVTSLLKTVKAVEDEHTRGTRALESTIEAIAQEIRVRTDGNNLCVIVIFRFSSLCPVLEINILYTIVTITRHSTHPKCRESDIHPKI